MKTKESPMSALDRAIEYAGGVGALAAGIDAAASAPSMWKTRGNVPAEWCPAIERFLGGRVRCEELRPDIPWDVLRDQSATSTKAA